MSRHADLDHIFDSLSVCLAIVVFNRIDLFCNLISFHRVFISDKFSITVSVVSLVHCNVSFNARILVFNKILYELNPHVSQYASKNTTRSD